MMGVKVKATGKLHYLGWFERPWKLITETATVDLWLDFEEVFKKLNRKEVLMERKKESFLLKADSNSTQILNYVPNEHVIIEEKKGFAEGGANVFAYLDQALIWLDGRSVIMERDSDHIKIIGDPAVKVPGLYFTGGGNSCKIPEEMLKIVCKVGQDDCCVFPSCSSGGFECEKFNGPMARTLLDRLAKGTMRAKRIGDCALLGRKD